MEIVLFDNNLASPTYQEDITEKVQGLNFSTKLNGGFHLCSFALKAAPPEAWEWLTKKIFYRIVISDFKKVVWEGRIQDPGLSAGVAVATAYGYWASLNDITTTDAWNVVMSTAIKNHLTNSCPQISADQTNIDTTDVSITTIGEAGYIDIKIQKIFRKYLEYGDASGNQWYFAIWENRIPYLKQRDTSTVQWHVNLLDLNKFKLRHRGGELWNSVYAKHGAGRTNTVTDPISIAKYGVTRHYGIPELGSVGIPAAEAARDRWLAEHKDVWPSLEDIILGDTVYDANDVPYPSSWVRAGEVIRILDLVPVTGDLDEVTRDALRTFYIMETNYNADRKENRIIVDTENKSLDAILARKL